VALVLLSVFRSPDHLRQTESPVDGPIRGRGDRKPNGEVPEILARSLSATDNDPNERDSSIEERLANSFKEDDLPPAKWAVQPQKQGEQYGAAAKIVCERYRAVAIGGRQLKIWCSVTGTKCVPRWINHLTRPDVDRCDARRTQLKRMCN